jgi:hypothetical protein
MTSLPPTNAHILAQQLLDAQVRYVRERLTGEQSIQTMTQAMDDILARAEHFCLQDVVSCDSIRGVVKTYAFELNLGGGVLELIGAIARQLHQHLQDHAPTLGQLMTTQSIDQWIEKIIELAPLRQQLAQQLIKSDTIGRILVQVLSLMLQQQFPHWLKQLTERVDQHANQPKRFAKIFQRLAQQEDQLSEWVVEQLAARIQHNGSIIIALDDVELRDLLNQIWYAIRELKLDYLAENLSPIDIEDFFVLVYEDWRRLRTHDFIQNLILTGVDTFFDIYGEYSLIELIDEVGITRQHMIGEIVRFAPPVLSALEQSGDLDGLLRSQIQPFFQAPETIRLIADALDHNRSTNEATSSLDQ